MPVDVSFAQDQRLDNPVRISAEGIFVRPFKILVRLLRLRQRATPVETDDMCKKGKEKSWKQNNVYATTAVVGSSIAF